MWFPKTLLVLFFYLLSFQVFCLTIKGSEPDYAGNEIIFYTYTDPVSRTQKELFKINFDTNGNFSIEVKISEPTFAFADIGIYQGLLFLQSDDRVTLYLPPRRDRSLAEQKNPYFKPVSTWLNIEVSSGENLNKLISTFDTRYNQLLDKYFNQLYIRQSKPFLDTILIVLEKEFSLIKNPVFKNHKALKLKLLEGDVSRENRERLFQNIELLAPYPWLHPAFMDAIDPVFTNKLSFEAHSVKGETIKKAVADMNLPLLKKFCEENYKVKDPVSSIILLKMLYDAFYSGEFPKTKIISMVESPFFTNHSNSSIRKFSEETSKKLKFLQPGSLAPVICLKNLSGETICTSNISKGIKYILFADAEIPVCQEHLKYLKQINQKFPGKCEIYIILYPSDKEKIKSFVTKNQVPGNIMIDESPVRYGRIYQVKSYPTAFLLDRNSQVILAPAKTPLDGFEQQLVSILHSERLNSLRNSQR